MSNKMTKIEVFATIKENYPTTANNYKEVIDLCEKSIEQLENKKASPSHNKEKEANELLRAEIFESMEIGKAYTITDMIAEIKCCNGMQNQRVTALVRGLLGRSVERTEAKGRAYFTRVV